MNPIVPQSARDFRTPPPVLAPVPVSVLLLPAPKPRLMLTAPKIAGYLPAPIPFAAGADAGAPRQQTERVSSVVSIAPVKAEKRGKRVVEAEIVNPLMLIDIHTDFEAWWEEFDRMYPSQTIEEMDAEIEAKHPGWIKLKESWS